MIERSLESWLRRLGYALSPLPPEERDDIVREIRSHFQARMDAASDPDEAFHATAGAFGSPEAYAAAFLDDFHISRAVADGSGLAMLRQAVRFVGRGSRAFFGALFFMVLFSAALALVAVAVLKLVFPAHVGAWWAPELGVMGIGFVDADTASRARDLLGYWIVPVNLLAALAIHRLGVALLRPFLDAFRSRDEEPGR